MYDRLTSSCVSETSYIGADKKSNKSKKHIASDERRIDLWQRALAVVETNTPQGEEGEQSGCWICELGNTGGGLVLKVKVSNGVVRCSHHGWYSVPGAKQRPL